MSSVSRGAWPEGRWCCNTGSRHWLLHAKKMLFYWLQFASRWFCHSWLVFDETPWTFDLRWRWRYPPPKPHPNKSVYMGIKHANTPYTFKCECPPIRAHTHADTEPGLHTHETNPHIYELQITSKCLFKVRVAKEPLISRLTYLRCRILRWEGQTKAVWGWEDPTQKLYIQHSQLQLWPACFCLAGGPMSPTVAAPFCGMFRVGTVVLFKLTPLSLALLAKPADEQRNHMFAERSCTILSAELIYDWVADKQLLLNAVTRNSHIGLHARGYRIPPLHFQAEVLTSGGVYGAVASLELWNPTYEF